MVTAHSIALVGFGEAGQALAQGWQLPPGSLSVFDTKTDNPATANAMKATYLRAAVEGATDLAKALTQRDLVMCLVPAGEGGKAAEAAAPWLATGACWIDGSSSSPGAKRQAAVCIEQAGGRYVDMAIMAPVHPKLHRTPVLLSGPTALATCQSLAVLGMEAKVVGERVGDASSIKMIRSILVKGLEALTAECFLAARKAGVEADVVASFHASDPSVDWQARTAYNLERMVVHGTRRAAEMREVVATLAELGLPGAMAKATVQWQETVGAMGILPDHPPDFSGQLDAILAAGP